MNYLLYFIPVLVGILEYISFSLALGYARYIVEQPVISLLGGIIKLGGNIQYEAVPDVVVWLHIIGFLLSLLFFVHFVILIPPSSHDTGENL